jgi:HK97 family phage major capsid protein
MDYRPELYIDILRAAMRVRQLGATVLTGLIGNVGIPALTKSATTAWIAENAAVTASDQEANLVTMTPKHCAVMTEVSRNMILQSSPEIEQLLRNDFAQLLAAALDRVAILGGGANEPTGILSATGPTDVPTGASGGPLTWTNVISLIAAVAGLNALQGALGFLTNSKVVKAASTILKTTSDTSSNFIISDPGENELAGYPLAQSNLVPSNLVKGGSGAVCSALIFANWADLLLGYWSAFDLLANPYDSTAYPKTCCCAA